jgi:hypothetical protein
MHGMYSIASGEEMRTYTRASVAEERALLPLLVHFAGQIAALPTTWPRSCPSQDLNQHYGSRHHRTWRLPAITRASFAMLHRFHSPL